MWYISAYSPHQPRDTQVFTTRAKILINIKMFLHTTNHSNCSYLMCTRISRVGPTTENAECGIPLLAKHKWTCGKQLCTDYYILCLFNSKTIDKTKHAASDIDIPCRRYRCADQPARRTEYIVRSASRRLSSACC